MRAARAPRTRASGAGSAASAGIAPASCPSSHQYAIAATVVRVLSFIPPRRHRRDSRTHRGRGRLALIELLNGGALAASLAALAVEEEPQLKPAEHAVAHYGAGALLCGSPLREARVRGAGGAEVAAGVEFRPGTRARLALERARRRPLRRPRLLREPVDDDDDEADSVASGVSARVDGVNFAVPPGGVGPVARRRPRRGLGPLGAHAADVVASHRSDVPEDPAVAPSRPGVLSFFAAAFLLPSVPGRGLADPAGVGFA